MKSREFAAALMIVSVLALPMTVNAQGRRQDDRRSRPRMGETAETGRRMPHMARIDWLERLKQEDPEEFERLQKLREEDPEQFRAMIRDRVKERLGGAIREALNRHDERCRELSLQYHMAESEDQKEALRKELAEAVHAAFDARLQDQEKFVEHLAKQLEHLKQRIETRRSKRQEICRRRLEELTEDPALRW